MFTVFNLKDIEPFNESEDKHIRTMLDGIQLQEGFEWLADLPLDRINFFFAKKMNCDNGVCGAFSYLWPNNIYLIDYGRGFKESPRPFGVEYVFPFAIHELRHCWQFTKHQFLYRLCSIPLIRELTTERDARKWQQMSQMFTDEFIRKEDEKQFRSFSSRWEEQP